jgi:hypothetical protein
LDPINLTAGAHDLQIHVEGTWANVDRVEIEEEIIILDCNGDADGTAYLDDCNVCVGGNTGQTACTQDCNGEWGGTAYFDSCDNCVGGSTGNDPCVHIPYNNVRASIPGTIQAEEYDLGGEGIAYHDMTLGNKFGVFRTDDVDVEAIPAGGYNLGEIAAGEWTNYLVQVTEGGDYQFNFAVASQVSDGSFYMEIDGQNVTGTVSVSSTGGWHTFAEIAANDISLSAGNHSMRIVATGPLFNLDAIRVEHQSITPPPGSGFKVVGYFPTWQGDVNAIQYDKLTHINYSFIVPNSSGGLSSLSDPGRLQQLVSNSHQNGVKVCIAVGGWNGGDDSNFEVLASQAWSRTAFVNNVMNFVNAYGLDGVDMDWEYPDPGSSADNFALLMDELANRLHAEGKILTAAVIAEGSQGGGVLASVFDDIDFLNLMAYDGGTPHSTYEYAVTSLNYWKGRGLPAEKAILGVPFYGRDPYYSYAQLVASDAGAPWKDNVGSVYYNGIPTIQSKTSLAINEAGGVMIWELSQDVTGPYSLLTAIDDQVNATASPMAAEPITEPAIEIYPNPSSGGEVVISTVAGGDEIAQIVIYDSNGEPAYQGELNAENGMYSYTVQSGELVQGMYYVKIVQPSGISQGTMLMY